MSAEHLADTAFGLITIDVVAKVVELLGYQNPPDAMVAASLAHCSEEEEADAASSMSDDKPNGEAWVKSYAEYIETGDPLTITPLQQLQAGMRPNGDGMIDLRQLHLLVSLLHGYVVDCLDPRVTNATNRALLRRMQQMDLAVYLFNVLVDSTKTEHAEATELAMGARLGESHFESAERVMQVVHDDEFDRQPLNLYDADGQIVCACIIGQNLLEKHKLVIEQVKTREGDEQRGYLWMMLARVAAFANQIGCVIVQIEAIPSSKKVWEAVGFTLSEGRRKLGNGTFAMEIDRHALWQRLRLKHTGLPEGFTFASAAAALPTTILFCAVGVRCFGLHFVCHSARSLSLPLFVRIRKRRLHGPALPGF